MSELTMWAIALLTLGTLFLVAILMKPCKWLWCPACNHFHHAETNQRSASAPEDWDGVLVEFECDECQKDLSQPVAKDHNHNQSLLDARRVDEFGQNKSALVGLVASTTDGAIVEANGSGSRVPSPVISKGNGLR